MLDTVRLYVRFTRPFTLLPPLLGVVSGAVTAWGSASNPHVLAGLPRQWTLAIVLTIVLGSACAAILNAASNVINQYYDFENDRINKPSRPLVTGEISMRAGYRTALALYAAPALGRTKADAYLANLTIAIPRGCLLKVAGWSMVASVFHVEPWFIGSIFFFFLVGAASTKDFSDMKGDEAAGCRTLPIRYGVTRAARMIAPFFVLPWLLMPLGAWVTDPWAREHTILTGNKLVLTGLGIGLALWGCYTVYLILRDPEDLAKVENHPSWTHMYLMMMCAQLGFAAAYL